ncbi:MAG: serine/threonine-protein kinase [Pirellulaceae bacterium]
MNSPAEPLKKTTPYDPDARLETRARFRRFTHACGARPLDGYTIKRGIGIGGFGEVYFALSDAGKEVALKRIERNFDVEMRGVSHCLNLKHLNLISLWDIKIDSQGTGWVVMEYVPGHSLKDVIDAQDAGMPTEGVADWFRGIASGVRYLHDRGIVHRDLKPGNIFRDSDTDVVKIGDYGLSKLISAGSVGSHTETVGTFHYMAPEVSRGSYGKEVDLYAIGVILYEMLTGNVPFDGETSHEIVMKHLTMDPDLGVVPADFRILIRSLLQKDPTKRCRDANAMLQGFENALRGEQPVALEKADSRGRDASRAKELMFISDDLLVIPDGDEMVFGEVVEVVTAESIELTESTPAADSVALGDSVESSRRPSDRRGDKDEATPVAREEPARTDSGPANDSPTVPEPRQVGDRALASDPSAGSRETTCEARSGAHRQPMTPHNSTPRRKSIPRRWRRWRRHRFWRVRCSGPLDLRLRWV